MLKKIISRKEFLSAAVAGLVSAAAVAMANFEQVNEHVSLLND
jgi:hypothetical protein